LSISFGLPVFSCPVMSNGLFQCQLNGPARGSYTIKASSNLTEWTPIITGVLPTSGVAIITDSASTNYNRRFYRAVMP
jgi:hypothetical protein